MTQLRTAVISTMKDEAPFLLEWVAHYKAIGFTDLVVCHNDCSDGTNWMLERLDMMGLVRAHRTKIRDGGIQRSALRQAARYAAVQAADWVHVCDADEFLNIHVGDGSVGALIAASGVSDQGRQADVIAVPWRRFGNAGVDRFFDKPVTDQFTRAEPADGRYWWHGAYCKSLVRGLSGVRRMGIHCPVPRDDLGRPWVKVMPGGIEVPEGTRHMKVHLPGYGGAQVNHYALRSVESFLIKKARGQVNRDNAPHDARYWGRYDLNHEEDTTIARTRTARAKWLRDLKSDAVLAGYHKAAVAWHRKRLEELRGMEDFAAIEAQLVTRAAA